MEELVIKELTNLLASTETCLATSSLAQSSKNIKTAFDFNINGKIRKINTEVASRI
jgi:hypothetical protein